MSLMFVAGVGTGCATSQTRAAFNGSMIVADAVNGAVDTWTQYVKTHHVTQEQIDAVNNAYDAYYAAQMVFRDALIKSVRLQAADPNHAASPIDLTAAMLASSDTRSAFIDMVVKLTTATQGQ